MKVSQILRDAHDEIAITGLTCGNDAKLKNGMRVGSTPNLDDPHVRASRHAYKDTVRRNQELLDASIDEIDSLCVQGALYRAAKGDIDLFNEGRRLVRDAFIEQQIADFTQDYRTLWVLNDVLKTIVADPKAATLDALLTASKIAEDAGN